MGERQQNVLILNVFHFLHSSGMTSSSQNGNPNRLTERLLAVDARWNVCRERRIGRVEPFFDTEATFPLFIYTHGA